MDNQEQNNDKQANLPRKKSVRSRYKFPSYNLGIAKQLAEKVEYDGAGKLSEATLAISLNASVKSSGFRLKVLAARHFQLLSKEREFLSTTPLAKAIFKPTSQEEKNRKLADAFMAIPLFNAVASRYMGQPLPSSDTFRNVLEREFGVESNRAAEAERVLIDSAREAGLLQEAGGKTYLVTEAVTTSQSSPSAQRYTPPSENPPPTTGAGHQQNNILNITQEDLLSFKDEEFDAIWGALGKILRKRGEQQQDNIDKSKIVSDIEKSTDEDLAF